MPTLSRKMDTLRKQKNKNWTQRKEGSNDGKKFSLFFRRNTIKNFLITLSKRNAGIFIKKFMNL